MSEEDKDQPLLEVEDVVGKQGAVTLSRVRHRLKIMATHPAFDLLVTAESLSP